MKPQFLERQGCVFLGRYAYPTLDYTHKHVDLWWCGGSMSTVIAQHGPAEADYESGLAFVPTSVPLAEAWVRAVRKNLPTEWDYETVREYVAGHITTWQLDQLRKQKR